MLQGPPNKNKVKQFEIVSKKKKSVYQDLSLVITISSLTIVHL